VEKHRGRKTLGYTLALLMLSVVFWAGAPASGQEMSPRDRDNDMRDQDIRNQETRNQQVATLDRFFDSHPEIAEQLRKDPSLISNSEFVERHQELQEFLQQHPGVREEFRENPNAFMRQERRFDEREEREDQGRFDRREDQDNGRVGDRDTTRRELRNMDRFLDSHPEIAEQLKKDPSLINNREFVERHPDLQQFLQQHPGVQEEFRENPNSFMRQEQRFDQREDRDNRNFGDRDTTPRELSNTDRFLDSHPEIAEQLRKDPTLINNRKFVDKHPELHEFLQQHPGVREEFRENPNAFMRQEQRFDQRENFGHRFGDGDTTRGELMSFGQFLNHHSTISQALAKDPSLVNNKEFMASHGDLQDFLKNHQQVKEELTENPQAFMNSVQQANTNSNSKTTAKTMVQTKHKQ
jgi:phage-related protein